MLKYILFLSILRSALPYEVTSFFDLISITGEWSQCCNDRFVPEYIWEQARRNTEICLERHPTDIICFDSCWMNLFKVLDRRYGMIKSELLKYLGTDIVLGDENDWKKNITETFVTECLDELQYGPSPQCNADARNWGICYWGKMFAACPTELGGGNCSF